MEYFSHLDQDDLQKLAEFSYVMSNTSLRLLHLLATRWKGDRVYIIGDYADLSEEDSDHEAPVRKAVLDALSKAVSGGELTVVSNAPTAPNRPLSISWFDALKDAYEGVMESESFWTAAEDGLGYTRLKKQKVNRSHNYRYILNEATLEYLDFEHCPVEWVYVDEEGNPRTNSFAPLNLLLTIGCGRGSGDYYSYRHSGNLVGAWVTTSRHIRVYEQEPKCLFAYTEFRPDFTECDPAVPWTKKESLLAEALEDKSKRKG
jgi:hypothetical protein